MPLATPVRITTSGVGQARDRSGPLGVGRGRMGSSCGRDGRRVLGSRGIGDTGPIIGIAYGGSLIGFVGGAPGRIGSRTIGAGVNGCCKPIGFGLAAFPSVPATVGQRRLSLTRRAKPS